MSTIDTSATINCPNCHFALTADARFCSRCGSALKKHSSSKLNLKQLFIILLSALIIGGGVYYSQESFQGKRPTQEMAKLNTNTDNPGAPLSSDEIFSKAEQAIQKIADSETPSPALILEAVDLLSRILSAEPTNAWALLQMAELSFEQRIFDKSSEFYARYLKTTPDDWAVKTRYASALTFSGKTEQALSELDAVLAIEPNNFQALAFSAIANQQAGKSEKSKELLAKAIIAAPNEEAKSRLLKFAESLNKKSEEGTNSTQAKDSGVTATPTGLSAARGNISANFSGLDSFFKNHPIAGPKYAGLEVKENEIRVSFNNFPMDKMPPMVKDKFAVNSANEAKKENNGQAYTLIFVDSGSGTEMHRVDIR